MRMGRIVKIEPTYWFLDSSEHSIFDQTWYKTMAVKFERKNPVFGSWNIIVLHSGSKQAWYRWYENHTNEGSHPSHREIPVISKYLDVLKALKILFRICRTSMLILSKLKQCISVWMKFKFVHIKDYARYKGEISLYKTIWSISNLLRVSISELDWFVQKRTILSQR